jgi:hypothetical protein
VGRKDDGSFEQFAQGALRRGYGGVVSHPPGRPGDPSGHQGDLSGPNGDELRAALRPAGELPERRPRRRRVEVDAVDESLRTVVEQAVADLVAHLDVTAEQIVAEAAASVTWSDSSCGCPEAGRAYPQVPVDGVYVRLAVDGRPFHYHGGGRRGLFRCEP